MIEQISFGNPPLGWNGHERCSFSRYALLEKRRYRRKEAREETVPSRWGRGGQVGRKAGRGKKRKRKFRDNFTTRSVVFVVFFKKRKRGAANNKRTGPNPRRLIQRGEGLKALNGIPQQEEGRRKSLWIKI
jgi:hypothetical protein